MMKILIIMDISVLSFYECIRDISTDIMTQNIGEPKIDQKL